MTAALIIAILAPVTAAIILTLVGAWAARAGTLTVRITRPAQPKTPPKENQ